MDTGDASPAPAADAADPGGTEVSAPRDRSAPNQEVERVVSLAPSTTATLSAMGAGDAVIGVTTHCPLDRRRVGGWLNPDYDGVADLDPDLVCTADPLQVDVRDELRERGYTVCHVEPDRLDAVIGSFDALGRAVGRPAAGERLAATARDRLAAVRERVPQPGGKSGRNSGPGIDDPRPVVYCEEWGDPPMAAGNWVPDAVATAGGRYPFVGAGERSRAVSRDRVERADPDHIVIHHCGHGDRGRPNLLADRGWDLDGAVHVLDDDLLNQPSPALLDGIDRLAKLFHGEE